MSWFNIRKTLPEGTIEASNTVQTYCDHIHWQVLGTNSICPMMGHCLDCGRDVGLDDLINGSIGRMQALIDKLEKV